MDIAYGQFANGDKTERRLSRRYVMRAPAALESENHQCIDIIICNMTEEGFEVSVVSDHVIPLYSVCVVQVDNFFNTRCFGIWSSGKRMGMLIASPIHDSVMASLAKNFPAPRHGEDLLGLPIG